MGRGLGVAVFLNDERAEVGGVAWGCWRCGVRMGLGRAARAPAGALGNSGSEGPVVALPLHHRLLARLPPGGPGVQPQKSGASVRESGQHHSHPSSFGPSSLFCPIPASLEMRNLDLSDINNFDIFNKTSFK